MRATTTSFVFEEIVRATRGKGLVAARSAGMVVTHKPKPSLNLVLLNREQLRIPNSSEWLVRVLSGQAWLTFGGADYALSRGDSLSVPKTRDGAIISAMGEEALFFEIT